jgi:putative oxidoreductase
MLSKSSSNRENADNMSATALGDRSHRATRWSRTTNGSISQWLAPYLLSVLRIVVAFLYIAHGTQKLFGYPSAEPRATVSLLSMLGMASVIEMVGGALLLVGLFTRPVAFVLAGEMAVAYFMSHAPRGFWPLVNRGEPAVLFCFTWLYFAAAGGGPWSLDALRRPIPPVSAIRQLRRRHAHPREEKQRSAA